MIPAHQHYYFYPRPFYSFPSLCLVAFSSLLLSPLPSLPPLSPPSLLSPLLSPLLTSLFHYLDCLMIVHPKWLLGSTLRKDLNVKRIKINMRNVVDLFVLLLMPSKCERGKKSETQARESSQLPTPFCIGCAPMSGTSGCG